MRKGGIENIDVVWARLVVGRSLQGDVERK